MIVNSDRNQFLGIHVTPDTKQKVKERAKETGKSMSLLASEILEEQLNQEEPKE